MFSMVRFAMATEIYAPIAVPLVCLKCPPLKLKLVLLRHNSRNRQSSSALSFVLAFRLLSLSRAIPVVAIARWTGRLWIERPRWNTRGYLQPWTSLAKQVPQSGRHYVDRFLFVQREGKLCAAGSLTVLEAARSRSPLWASKERSTYESSGVRRHLAQTRSSR